ncbi:MAG: hypothetical protein HY795_11935 [Desulfovibrio sp.]|nr:hypothetical protein [Desulfovibrio sp.]MBI4958096.1 hypothetical protein [Desulfovibrio sp.]
MTRQDAMATLPASPPWEEISRASFVFEENCWETCGGYCCDIRHGDFTFNLLPSEGTSILHIGDEYDWMLANGHIPPDASPREIVFDFGGPGPIRLVAVDCKLKGVCGGERMRPLHCRIYPFLPIFNAQSELIDIYPASIFDLTCLAREGKAACTLWNERRDIYMEAWKSGDILKPLHHPLLMFYFAVYKCAADNYLENLKKNAMLASLDGAAFWQRWELLYLGKRLFDAPAIREMALGVYHDFSRVHGDFLAQGS